ncbi:zinc finger protein 776-like [Uranotaenia lowii]|uniref:zinc finger protein 776-like n=1 Tax=Uranotaenia lowii TaxID=190385 RepID=UPI002479CFDE|nr:zinc finger protein 776-like [Uranotaenia lowii]
MEFETNRKRLEFLRENFKRLCRFCGAETNNLTRIFGDISEEVADHNLTSGAGAGWVYNSERNIGQLLEKQYVPFTPSDELNLPNYICEKCVDSLVRWHRFRETFYCVTKLLLEIVTTDPKHDQLSNTRSRSNSIGEEDTNDSADQNGDCDFHEVEALSENSAAGDFDIKYMPDIPENATFDDVTIIETLEEETLLEAKHSIDIEEEPEEILITRTRSLRKPKADRVGRKTRVKNIVQDTNTGKQCPECGVIVRYKMKHHMLRHADPEGRPFKCEQCDKSYSVKRNLIEHISHKHENISYGCLICGKTFVSRDVLRTHTKLHLNQEFRCELCDQVFQQSIYLKKHMVMHEEKRFACDVCNKNFRFKQLLKQHMRIHTGEKPYQCPHCEKQFRTRAHLNQHQRTHTQEKAFKCSVCPMAYANKKSRDRHQLEHD